MPDWKKRVNKERAADLNGETLEAATYYQGFGSAAGQIAFGMASGVGRMTNLVTNADAQADGADLRTKIITRKRDGFNMPEGSVAASFPNIVGIFAITDKRLIAFPYKQGFFSTKILDPVVSVDREQLAGWSYRKGSLVWSVFLAFVDESDLGLEIPRVNKPSAFVEALGIPEMS